MTLLNPTSSLTFTHHALNEPNEKMTIKDKYDVLIENNTWTLVPHLSNASVIQSLWTFRHKKNFDESFKQYKIHLVNNGANH